mmetsp:Transcript_19950/g.53326  ORF Transcript_19950/g.53326 Transcript_19950/m.53326 type:complete len:233 (-) Transcript_19950:208-906(-)
MEGTSGTTIRLPVMCTLSPGLQRSQHSSRTITSIDRGMEPAGTSFSLSWSRMRCQSPHRVVRLSASSVQLVRFPQLRPGQATGIVHLNCWTTPLTSREQTLHWYVPTSSSGFISVVLVTVPHTVTSLPSWSVRRSRIPLWVPMFQKDATNLVSSFSRACLTSLCSSGSSSFPSSSGTAALRASRAIMYFDSITCWRSVGSKVTSSGRTSARWETLTYRVFFFSRTISFACST